MHAQSDERPLIIERPDLQSTAQRFGYLSVTFICWFFWLYLFVPLLSLLAWVLGARALYQVLIQHLTLAELAARVTTYGIGILVFTSIYIMWAVTSYLRYRNVDRREQPTAVGDAALAASHGLSDDELAELRRLQQGVVSMEHLERMFGTRSDGDLADTAVDLDEKAA